MRNSKFTLARHGAAISVKVTPRAKKTEVAGLMADGTVKIRVAAPPAEGAANKALVEFLGQILGLAEDQIEILAGEAHQRKLVTLIGISPEAVDATFQRLVTRPSPSRRKARG